MKDSKNLLIAGLLAVVLVMAVGFAAFSTSLNINGSAKITSSWNVHFVTGTTAEANYAKTTGLTNGTAPTASMSITNTNATLSASFTQPGDSVTYTLTVQNDGSLNAKLADPTIKGTNCTVSGLNCTTSDGNIKFTVTAPATALNTGKSTTMTVKAEFVNKTVSAANTENASISIGLNATQA